VCLGFENRVKFFCPYLSKNAGKTEESVVQSGSEASSDMVIAANYYVNIFLKMF
jgi:hypothetical protein